MANTKITTNVIADDAITTAKIADDAVGNDQLASGLTLGGNTTATIIGNVTGNVTGNTSGTAATVTGAAQTNITSVGTLSALTISGDLTVDTSTLKVDSSNNRVGIGNPSPDRQLSLKHASQAEIGFKTGSVSNGALIYYNDSENQLLLRAQESGEHIAFQTGGTTERMRIDSSGKVLVGAITGSADGTLAVKTNSNTHAIAIEENSGNEVYQLGVTTAGDLGFYNSGATTPTVTFSDGDYVGIGTSGPTRKLDVRAGSGAGTHTHAIFTGTSSRGLEIRTRSDTSGGQNSGTAEINSADAEGTGGDLALSSNGNVRMFIDGAGHMGFNTTSIQTFTNYTSYHFTPNGTTSTALLVDDSTGSSGRLQLFMAGSAYIGTRSNDPLIFTTNDAARMRILANGVFIHGKSTDDVDTIGWIVSTNGSVYSSTNSSNNSYHYRDTTNTRYNFYVGGNGQVNARTNSIGIISDARLKENIRDYTVGLNDILKLKPRVFDWIPTEGEKDQVGFIAQEFEEVFPNWIGNFLHDDLDDAKSVSASEIIYPMVNAIKELKAEIDALKEKLNG